MPPKDETASTISRAPWSRTILPISRMGLMVPGRRVVMDQRHDLDVRPLLEGRLDRGGIDRLIERHFDLDHVLVIARRPIAEALAVDAGGEVEHRILRPDQRGRGRLDRRRRLHLQDQRRRLERSAPAPPSW